MADRWRSARRLMDEDVTVLGEQLGELHIDTLADDWRPATNPWSGSSVSGTAGCPGTSPAGA